MLLNVCMDVLQTYNNNELIQSYWSGLLLILPSGLVMLNMLYNTFTEAQVCVHLQVKRDKVWYSGILLTYSHTAGKIVCICSHLIIFF